MLSWKFDRTAQTWREGTEKAWEERDKTAIFICAYVLWICVTLTLILNFWLRNSPDKKSWLTIGKGGPGNRKHIRDYNSDFGSQTIVL